MEYKCEIPVEGSEKRIISKLIKQVKKEWLIKEVVKSSPGFSVIYEDKFEEGENICYFVKKDNYLTFLKNSLVISCEYFLFSLNEIRVLDSSGEISTAEITPPMVPRGSLLTFAVNLTYGTSSP